MKTIKEVLMLQYTEVPNNLLEELESDRDSLDWMERQEEIKLDVLYGEPEQGVLYRVQYKDCGRWIISVGSTYREALQCARKKK